MKLMKFSFAVVLLCVSVGQAQAAVEVVLANNPAGDNFSPGSPAPGGSLPLVNDPGWVYNNVRNGASIGINTTQPRSGNGSVSFIGTGSGDKADIEYYNVVNGSLASMGTLGQVTSLAYDWYKNSSSAAAQHASLRILVDADGNLNTTNDRGALVYERAYQTNSSVPTDQWVADSLMTANLWQVWFGNGNFDTAGNWQPLAIWGSVGGFTPSGGGLLMNASSVIYGLSSGIGSGWSAYTGSVDNITIGFGTLPATTYNFEVRADGVVPEPMTIAVWSVLGLCASAFAWRAKRRQSAA